MNPFKLISSHEVYRNPWIQVREDKVTKNGESGLFGVVTIGNGVGVLAVDEKNNVFLAKEFKYGLGREDINIPGGGIDSGEDPIDTAKRELKEELGIIANEWISLGIIHPLTTVVKETENLFLARKLTVAEKVDDGWENTQLIRIPYKKALEMVMNSEITHGASVVAILKAQKYIH